MNFIYSYKIHKRMLHSKWKLVVVAAAVPNAKREIIKVASEYTQIIICINEIENAKRKEK